MAEHKEVVYFIEAENTGCIKIGFTSKLKERLSLLKCGNHADLCCVAQVDGGSNVEEFFHKLFFKKRVKGEWFRLSVEEVHKAIYDNRVFIIKLQEKTEKEMNWEIDGKNLDCFDAWEYIQKNSDAIKKQRAAFRLSLN